MKANNKIFFLKLLCFVPLLMILVLINYYAYFFNVKRMFKERTVESFFQIASEAFQRGSSVISMGVLPIKGIKRAYFEDYAKHSDVVVFGTCHSDFFNSDIFEKKSFHNDSAPGSFLNDHIIMYYRYKKKNILPETVIIEMDPLFFSDHFRVDTLINEENYDYALEWLNLKNKDIQYRVHTIVFKQYLELFSISKFQKVKNVVDRIKIDLEMFKTREINVIKEVVRDDYPEGTCVLRPDGSWIHPYAVDIMKLRNEASSAVLSIEPFIKIENLDKVKKQMIHQFIRLMQEDGVNVIFYLPPYHPVTYARLLQSSKHDHLPEIEEYFHELAESYHITIIGSYDPHKMGLDESDFCGANNLTLAGGNKLMKAMNLAQVVWDK